MAKEPIFCFGVLDGLLVMVDLVGSVGGGIQGEGA
jgi:hypothetical protein